MVLDGLRITNTTITPIAATAQSTCGVALGWLVAPAALRAGPNRLSGSSSSSSSGGVSFFRSSSSGSLQLLLVVLHVLGLVAEHVQLLAIELLVALASGPSNCA